MANLHLILLIAALILAILAGFGIGGRFNLGWFALACFVAAALF